MGEDRGVDEFKKELQRVLVAMWPVIDWSAALPAAGLNGPDVWHREDSDLWPMSGPPEDYALPPLVRWTDELRLLAEQSYQDTYGRFLEPDESYQFAWPPRGALWDPGSWYYSDTDGGVVVEPATWSWELPVERIVGNGIEDEQPWPMGETHVDPRTVEYSVFGGSDAHGYVEVLQDLVERVARGGEGSTQAVLSM